MIWKALADPTRRSILNLLKKAPRTTGEISQQFENLSRYAVMKHLGVLEKANLISVKREGKFRWNHLNTQPIQQSYEEWVSNLIQLRMLAGKTTDDMSQADKTITTTTVFIHLEIKAKRTRVWKALIHETNLWWKEEFNRNPKTRNFVLEPKLGGLMFEDAGTTEGLTWATVIGINSPSTLQLKGHLSPENGGPAITFTKIELLAKGKSNTKLKVSETVFGSISEKIGSDLSDGWKTVFEKGLKAYLERTT